MQCSEAMVYPTSRSDSSLYEDSKMVVRVNNELGEEWFAAEIDSRQDDPISPIAFITLLERVMETVECDSGDIGVYTKHTQNTLQRLAVCRLRRNQTYR
mgnify:CR=1 FL=1